MPFTDAVGEPKPGRVPIAVVMTSFEPGGTERHMIEMVRGLDPNRWAVAELHRPYVNEQACRGALPVESPQLAAS